MPIRVVGNQDRRRIPERKERVKEGWMLRKDENQIENHYNQTAIKPIVPSPEKEARIDLHFSEK
ncbi:MAG: hypothetical protein A2900_01450 [Candidatus Chisholmbacteria bacterium RIFCSPLOWO2_01_FULL_50_28]|uniref:Uncharacterized protein n=1 Tax=Candidatus Chisholmbacteria bacterium RIFCSPHIGHO2_01_FULL_52_32 TaxID=1797591 RepID=A0A1G1VU82_9BACT|nr:MAG: hypothetical protein A2786_05290 [Candidatus Chisholmbacteria bacterium RIFCSPHIGHO2_01_FULL_52_32]OGY19755.1 MAG: hypothetical protein A2900_01450 [Candidatus Chisholmbacteria bacterium RIFCSPLOWO2_01_FULL_50_28]